jgi:hypothetical protein
VEQNEKIMTRKDLEKFEKLANKYVLDVTITLKHEIGDFNAEDEKYRCTIQDKIDYSVLVAENAKTLQTLYKIMEGELIKFSKQ